MFQQLLLNALWTGVWLIYFIDSNNERDFSRLCVIDSLDCLWLHSVIGSDHKNHNICNVGPSGTHGRECFMTWSIEESDVVIIMANVVGTNVLGNASSFTFGNFR